jgi:CRISPR-associated protein Csh2
MVDFQFDFNKLKTVADSEKVNEVRFYTEIEAIKNALLALGNEKIKSIDIFTK